MGRIHRVILTIALIYLILFIEMSPRLFTAQSEVKEQECRLETIK